MCMADNQGIILLGEGKAIQPSNRCERLEMETLPNLGMGLIYQDDECL